VTAVGVESGPSVAVVGRRGAPAWLRQLGSMSLNIWALIGLLYLFLPIFVIIAFSFNEPGNVIDGEFQPTLRNVRNYEWGRFSLDAWSDPFKYDDLTHAFFNSLKIAAIATLVASVLGTLMAIALVKYRFRGRGPVSAFLILPLTMPEVVLGLSLLALFVNAGVGLGFTTIFIAHVMFCVSYVATTVKARIRGFDWTLEEAAADLGASPRRTFFKVTLPLIAPGIFAAALLTFALSLDDFVITYLNRGLETTFPVQVWLLKRSSVPVQVNVFGTIVLVASVSIALLGLVVQRRRDRPVV
jgi:spermidine/putrescine transport system permease protein